MTRRGWVLFVAMGVIWGLPYLLIKVSVKEISPALLVLLRTGGGALLLLPIAAARGAIRPLLKHWRPLVAYTAVELGGPWFLLFRAEERLSSSLSGLLIAAVPLAGALLAWLTGSDRLDGRRLIGLGAGFGGVALLVGFAVGHSDLWAAASLGGVVIGYALGPWILARHLSEAPPLGVVAGSLVLCAVVYAPIALLQGLPKMWTASVIESVAALTVICTATAFVLFFALIAEVGPMRATVITYVNPAVAVVLGVTVLGERIGVATVAGFLLILLGCFFATGHARTRASAEPVEVPACQPATDP